MQQQQQQLAAADKRLWNRRTQITTNGATARPIGVPAAARVNPGLAKGADKAAQQEANGAGRARRCEQPRGRDQEGRA
jgi:hypothetical protein